MMDFDFLNQNSQMGLGGGGNGGFQFGQDPFSSIPTTTTAMPGAIGDLSGQYSMPLMDRMQGTLGKVGQWGAQNGAMLNFGVGALTGLANLYQGNKQMGLFKDQLSTQKAQWDSQYNMNRSMVNNQLADRQDRRIAANPDGNVTSREDYMKKWGV